MIANRYFLITVFIFLCGCQSKETASSSSRILVKVNGEEITEHQVSNEVQRLRVSGEHADVVSKKILSGLIDRQLLIQEAIKLNLDRSPDVVQLLEAARAQIYAQAYLAKKLSRLPAASEQEVKQFMIDHPEVFKHRRVLGTTDIAFAKNAHKIDYEALRASVGDVDELRGWLDNHQIKYEVSEGHVPTESLPKEALTFADQIKVGDLLFIHDDERIVARSVTSITEVPLESQQAKNMATKAVNDYKQHQLFLNEIQRLKRMAKIEVIDPAFRSAVEEASNGESSSTP